MINRPVRMSKIRDSNDCDGSAAVRNSIIRRVFAKNYSKHIIGQKGPYFKSANEGLSRFTLSFVSVKPKSL